VVVYVVVVVVYVVVVVVVVVGVWGDGGGSSCSSHTAAQQCTWHGRRPPPHSSAPSCKSSEIERDRAEASRMRIVPTCKPRAGGGRTHHPARAPPLRWQSTHCEASRTAPALAIDALQGIPHCSCVGNRRTARHPALLLRWQSTHCKASSTAPPPAPPATERQVTRWWCAGVALPAKSSTAQIRSWPGRDPDATWTRHGHGCDLQGRLKGTGRAWQRLLRRLQHGDAGSPCHHPCVAPPRGFRRGFRRLLVQDGLAIKECKRLYRLKPPRVRD